MRLIIALLLPWLLFFTIGRPLAGIVCLALQVTLVGWLPAAIWAVYSLSQYKTDPRPAGGGGPNNPRGGGLRAGRARTPRNSSRSASRT